jgi:hypothetical protein
MRSANLDLKALADRMLSFKKPGSHTFVHFTPVGVDAREIMARLRASTLADLVLPEGASLSMAHTSDYYPDLGVTAQDAQLGSVMLTVLGWSWEKYAAYPKAPAWGRQIEISLWYGRTGRADPLVKQVFAATAYDRSGLPRVARDVWADLYAEQGYQGHNQECRDARSAAETRFFIDLAAELFAATPEGRPS